MPQSFAVPLHGAYAGRTTVAVRHGSSAKTVILSNMNTNRQDEWQPLIRALNNAGYTAVTYEYPDPETDQWEVLRDVIAYVAGAGDHDVVLIGASRGGVTSMQVLCRADVGEHVLGVAALSAPVSHEDAVFFEQGELEGIPGPKLLMNSDDDECASGTRAMHEALSEPKELVFYPGSAHGTELFLTEPVASVQKLVSFTDAVFAGSKNR